MKVVKHKDRIIQITKSSVRNWTNNALLDGKTLHKQILNLKKIFKKKSKEELVKGESLCYTN